MGRPPGALNKTTVAAKQAIMAAADILGGVDRLVAWVREDPKNEGVFWASIYTKLVPHDVNHGVTSELAAILDRVDGRTREITVPAQREALH